MKNGKNTDLNNQNLQFWSPLKSQKRPRMNLPMARNNFYVQQYRETQSKEKLKHNQAKNRFEEKTTSNI